MAEPETGKVNPNPEAAETRSARSPQGCHEVCGHAGGRNLESSGGRRGGRNSSVDGDRPPSSPVCLDHGHWISDGMVPGLLPLLSAAHSF